MNTTPQHTHLNSNVENDGSVVRKDTEVLTQRRNPNEMPTNRTDWVGKRFDGPSVSYNDRTAMAKTFKNEDGGQNLTVIINGLTQFTIFGKSIGEFYGLNEGVNESFGSFASDLFYRLDNCMFGHSFHILKCDRTAKLEKSFTYNVIDPSESIVGPITSATDYQHSGFTVHPTEDKEKPHLRRFSVYGTDEEEIDAISDHYQWFVEDWDVSLFGSSDVHYHWSTEGASNPSERRMYALSFFDRYQRNLNGEDCSYPISFDVWGVQLGGRNRFVDELNNDIPF